MKREKRLRAGPGEGTKNPEEVSEYNVTQGGTRTGLIIRWHGNGYDSEDSWIRADVGSVFDLTEHE